MKKKYIILCLFFLSGMRSRATDDQYPVMTIPIQLLKGSNAVVRLDEHHVTLKSLEKMAIRTRYIVTILNEKGDDLAEMSEMYDRFTSIESIEGYLYNAEGKKIKSVKKSDVRDVSMYSEMSLADDGRLKVHNFFYKVYPYTVEYIVETVKKETMFFPQWIPVPDEFVGVEKSIISIEVPAEYKLRYRTFNYNKEPVIQPKNDRVEYTWELSNYAPVTKEYASPSWRNITPVVMMAPSEFIIEDYKGSMRDWKELGLFQSTLNKGRSTLPPAVKQQVLELTKDATSTREKVERLYKYLQNNTRYVSIQLGVGGWQPFEASYVASKRYGDCKALSNYMYSLLKEAGIVSYYTLIKAGENTEDIVEDFPSRQFNHVIVCVPDGRDTIWLECTSQTTAAGYMGKFTGNRHALLITDEGGKLVCTPKYTMNDNLQSRNVKAVLGTDGTLAIKVITNYFGLQQDDIQGVINYLSKDKIKDYLHEQLDFATYDVNRFDYKEDKSTLPSINESLDITVSNYATITGKRLFIVPNVMTRSYRKLSQDTARKYDIQMVMEYRDVDTVEIELPAGYATEAMPQDVAIKSPFGKYTCSVKLKDNKLYYYRAIESYSGRFSAKEYNDLAKFYESVYKADRNKVVLVKNETPAKGF